jgi:hypothetical protein
LPGEETRPSTGPLVAGGGSGVGGADGAAVVSRSAADPAAKANVSFMRPPDLCAVAASGQLS